MKRITALVFCLLLILSFVGCGNKEEVILQAEEVHEIITYYYETNGEDGNYINSYPIIAESEGLFDESTFEYKDTYSYVWYQDIDESKEK